MSATSLFRLVLSIFIFLVVYFALLNIKMPMPFPSEDLITSLPEGKVCFTRPIHDHYLT
jgi:hypothetical protein